MQETWVGSLGWEDPLEKEMAAHSSILAWKIPWTTEPGRLPSMGSQRLGHDWATSLSLSLSRRNKDAKASAEKELTEDWTVYGVTRVLVVTSVVLLAGQGCWSHLCAAIWLLLLLQLLLTDNSRCSMDFSASWPLSVAFPSYVFKAPVKYYLFIYLCLSVSFIVQLPGPIS